MFERVIFFLFDKSIFAFRLERSEFLSKFYWGCSVRLISRIVCSVLAVQTAVGPMAMSVMAAKAVKRKPAQVADDPVYDDRPAPLVRAGDRPLYEADTHFDRPARAATGDRLRVSWLRIPGESDVPSAALEALSSPVDALQVLASRARTGDVVNNEFKEKVTAMIGVALLDRFAEAARRGTPTPAQYDALFAELDSAIGWLPGSAREIVSSYRESIKAIYREDILGMRATEATEIDKTVSAARQYIRLNEMKRALYETRTVYWNEADNFTDLARSLPAALTPAQRAEYACSSQVAKKLVSTGNFLITRNSDGSVTAQVKSGTAQQVLSERAPELVVGFDGLATGNGGIVSPGVVLPSRDRILRCAAAGGVLSAVDMQQRALVGQYPVLLDLLRDQSRDPAQSSLPSGSVIERAARTPNFRARVTLLKAAITDVLRTSPAPVLRRIKDAMVELNPSQHPDALIDAYLGPNGGINGRAARVLAGDSVDTSTTSVTIGRGLDLGIGALDAYLASHAGAFLAERTRVARDAEVNPEWESAKFTVIAAASVWTGAEIFLVLRTTAMGLSAAAMSEAGFWATLSRSAMMMPGVAARSMAAQQVIGRLTAARLTTIAACYSRMATPLTYVAARAATTFAFNLALAEGVRALISGMNGHALTPEGRRQQENALAAAAAAGIFYADIAGMASVTRPFESDATLVSKLSVSAGIFAALRGSRALFAEIVAQDVARAAAAQASGQAMRAAAEAEALSILARVSADGAMRAVRTNVQAGVNAAGQGAVNYLSSAVDAGIREGLTREITAFLSNLVENAGARSVMQNLAQLSPAQIEAAATQIIAAARAAQTGGAQGALSADVQMGVNALNAMRTASGADLNVSAYAFMNAVSRHGLALNGLAVPANAWSGAVQVVAAEVQTASGGVLPAVSRPGVVNGASAGAASQTQSTTAGGGVATAVEGPSSGGLPLTLGPRLQGIVQAGGQVAQEVSAVTRYLIRGRRFVGGAAVAGALAATVPAAAADLPPQQQSVTVPPPSAPPVGTGSVSGSAPSAGSARPEASTVPGASAADNGTGPLHLTVGEGPAAVSFDLSRESTPELASEVIVHNIAESVKRNPAYPQGLRMDFGQRIDASFALKRAVTQIVHIGAEGTGGALRISGEVVSALGGWGTTVAGVQIAASSTVDGKIEALNVAGGSLAATIHDACERQVRSASLEDDLNAARANRGIASKKSKSKKSKKSKAPAAHP